MQRSSSLQPPEADRESSQSSSKASEHSSTRTLEGEEHLHVVHEFSRVGRLEDIQEVPLEFLDSVDVLKVEKHMLSLLGYPGASLVHMHHELAIYIYLDAPYIYRAYVIGKHNIIQIHNNVM
jgi:hypothetical protein